MREFERIARIIDLVTELSKLDPTLDLGPLLQKYIWEDWIEKRGDIFQPQDGDTEERLQKAIATLKDGREETPLTPDRTRLLEIIAGGWPTVPDQRFGQFLSNYLYGHFLSHPKGMLLQQSDASILAGLVEVKE